MFRALVALAFIGLAALFIGTDPQFNVQNALMGFAAIVSTIAALIPTTRARPATKPNPARRL